MKKITTLSGAIFLTAVQIFAGTIQPNRQEYANPLTIKDLPRLENNLKQVARHPAPASNNTPSIVYGYCGEPFQSFGISWAEYTALVEFPEAFVNKYDGARVTSVQIASPDNFMNPEINNFTSINLCFYREKGGEAFYSQPATLSSKGFDWADIALETPVEIEAGKPFFVGYSGIAPTIDDACFTADGNYNSLNYGLWLGYTDSETGEYKWEPYTEWYGNLCLRLVLESDNLPTDEMTVEGIYPPGSVFTNEPFSVLATVTNKASNDIENITLEYSTGKQNGTIVVNAEPAIKFGESRDILIDGLVCDTIGARVPLECRITAINGNPDATIENLAETQYIILSMPEGVGFDRNVVVEEGTGTWCGYCPMGIVGMEYMSNKYTDGSFIPIAIHYNDRMESKTYGEIAKKHFENYPSALVNRDTTRVGIIQPEAGILEIAYTYLREMPAYAEISMAASYTDENRSALSVNTSSHFAIDTEDTYSVIIALTENNVGPYKQENYFANYAEGIEMGGFETMEEQVSITFNDVARSLSASEAIGCETGTSYETHMEIPLETLSSKDDFSVVAMIVNDKTGEIENAVAQHSASISTGIVNTAKELAKVSARKGMIEVTGATSETQTTVYTPAGTVAGAIKGNGAVGLSSGLYIVRCGDKCLKVSVK